MLHGDSSRLFSTRYTERSGRIKTPGDQMSHSASQEYSASRSRELSIVYEARATLYSEKGFTLNTSGFPIRIIT